MKIHRGEDVSRGGEQAEFVTAVAGAGKPITTAGRAS